MISVAFKTPLEKDWESVFMKLHFNIEKYNVLRTIMVTNIIFTYDNFMKVRKKTLLTERLRNTFGKFNFDLNDFVCVPNDSTEQLVLVCDAHCLKVEEYLPVIA